MLYIPYMLDMPYVLHIFWIVCAVCVVYTVYAVYAVYMLLCFICCIYNIYSICCMCCMCCIYWNSLICRTCCICCMRCICCMYCICCIYCIDCISIGLLNIYPGGGRDGDIGFAWRLHLHLEFIWLSTCVCACACVVLCGAGVAVSAMSHRFTKGEPKCPTPPDGQRLKCVVSAARRCVCAACRGSSGGPGLGTWENQARPPHRAPATHSPRTWYALTFQQPVASQPEKGGGTKWRQDPRLGPPIPHTPGAGGR